MQEWRVYSFPKNCWDLWLLNELLYFVEIGCHEIIFWGWFKNCHWLSNFIRTQLGNLWTAPRGTQAYFLQQWTLDYLFRPKEGNKAAHLMATHAKSVPNELVWLEEMPIDLMFVRVSLVWIFYLNFAQATYRMNFEWIFYLALIFQLQIRSSN